MVQKKICQDSFKFQNEDTSSMANNKPPTGAPNADATPAPAPAEMKLRLRKKILVIRSNITGKDVRKHFLLRWGLNVYNRGVFFTTSIAICVKWLIRIHINIITSYLPIFWISKSLKVRKIKFER